MEGRLLFSNYVPFCCQRGGYKANSTCPPSHPCFFSKSLLVFFTPFYMERVRECFHDTEMNRWQYQPIQKRHSVVPITVATTLDNPHGVLCFCSIEGKAPSPFVWLALPLSVHSSDSHHPQSLFDIRVFHTGIISGSH